MTKRISVLQIRLAPEELEQVRNDALAQGCAVSEYIRRALLRKPEEMIAKGSPAKELPDSGNIRPDAGRECVPAVSATTLPNGNCFHDYGPKRCPFPDCRNYKWGK